MTEEVDFVFLQRYFIGKILDVNNGVSLRVNGDGAGGTTPNPSSSGFWDCVTEVNLETWVNFMTDGGTTNQGVEIDVYPLSTTYSINFAGGGMSTGISFISAEQDCEWISDNTPYNDIVLNGGASSGGGGSSYNNQTNSWYKCKNYLKENYNTEIAPEDEQYLKDLYDNCGGCAKAFFTSKKQLEKLKSANTSQKVKCAICKLNTNGFTGTTYFDVWDNISFPCENVDKDALLDELLPDCFSNTPVSWTQFMEAVGTKTWINKTLIASEESSGSSNLKNLELILGISKDKQKSLTDEDLCNVIQIAECLKPSAPGGPIGVNEAEKAALLDFYQNTDLTNPCTGDAIDKDAIFLDLCESDNLSMSGLNIALDGVDKIIPDQSFKNCSHLKCVYDAIAKQNNSLWCNTIANFDNFESTDLILQLDGGKNNIPSNYFTTNPKSKGVTGLNGNGQVVIAFNPLLCDSDQPLLIANTILHEGIHAEIWRYMKENWTLGEWPDNVNNSTSIETFKKLFELCCTSSVLTNQHNLMLEQWIDHLAKGLWEFNGEQGSKEDYKYLAIQGIWDKDDACSKNLISELEYDKLRAKFLNIPNYFTFDKCD